MLEKKRQRGLEFQTAWASLPTYPGVGTLQLLSHKYPETPWILEARVLYHPQKSSHKVAETPTVLILNSYGNECEDKMETTIERRLKDFRNFYKFQIECIRCKTKKKKIGFLFFSKYNPK